MTLLSASSTDPNSKLARRDLFLAALALGAGLAFSGPAAILSRNPDEFEFGLLQYLPSLLIATALIICVVMAVDYIAGERKRLAVAVTTLALFAWIQAAFLLGAYGSFDGRGIDWNNFGLRSWIDIPIWIVGIACAQWWLGPATRLIRPVSALLLASGLIALPFQGALPWSRDGVASEIAPEDILIYSSQKNVVHFILDSFQTDVFLEPVEEEGLASKFSGFVNYRENAAVANMTSYAVPAIFSGRSYDTTQSAEEYYQESVIQDGFPGLLHANGYAVRLTPHLSMLGSPLTAHYPSPDLYATPRDARIRDEAALLLDISLFQHLPHQMRRAIHNEERWFLSRIIGSDDSSRSFHQKRFFEDYTQRLRASSDQPTYHFVHLMPPHPPYTTLEDGTDARTTLPHTRENYLHECRAILRLFVAYLDRLRADDIYDSALIVLQGDHGSSFAPHVNGQEVDIGRTRVPALLSIKLPNAQGPMQISDAPTALSDLPKTLMEALGVEHSYPGRSILALREQERRPRDYFIYSSNQGAGTQVERHRVDGSIYDPSAWSQLSSATTQAHDAAYRWGQMVQFGVSGNAGAYKRDGWTTPDSRLEWTSGNSASLVFEATPPTGDVQLEFVFRAHVNPGNVERQRIGIVVNGHPLTQRIATDAKFKQFRGVIPRAWIQDGRVELRFELPDAISPKAAGLGGDERVLGIAMGQLSLSQTP
jgi:hypothetical protein